MDIIEEGKIYALFYYDKDKLAGKLHIKKTIENWVEANK